MNSIRIVVALALTLSAHLCLGYDYNAKTGALSYTFFNLSPNTCYVTSYQGGTVPGAYAEPASLYGWNSGDNWLCTYDHGKQSGPAASFFNPSVPSCACVNACAGTSGYNTSYYFYGWGSWLDTSSTAPSASLNSGTALTTVEYSTSGSKGANDGNNPPAIGDSWTIQCGGGTDGGCATGGTCSGTIVMANLTSAANMFISGQGPGGVNEVPGDGSEVGNFPNSGINPPSPGSPTGAANPLGVGFVPSTMNMNPTGSTSGGLWLGLSNPNNFGQAGYAINAAMYPLNLSTYVGSNSVNSSLGIGMDVTPIYGGHLTLAIGDPFLVSSFAAKTLWYMVSVPTISLSASTLDANGMGSLINLLVNGGSSGGATVSPVFYSTTSAFSYLQWLLGTGSGNTAASWGAAGTAASVVSTMNSAASTPITHESFWGKLVTSSLNFGVDVLNANIPTLLGGSTYVNNTAKVAGTDVNGDLLAPVTSAITAAATSTISQPAPTMANAPPVVNNTYSSSDLLGMLLANGFAQAAIDTTVFSTSTNSGDQLYANFTISDVDAAGVATYCTGIDVQGSLLSGNCYTTNSSGNLTTTTVNNDCSQSSGCPQSYLNVLATAPGAQSNTQLSIWDAILTGSDITTVQSTTGAANNGYMMMQNPAIPAFSPPTQVVNATLNWPLNITAINTTFNLSSGLLSLASYSTVADPNPSLNAPVPTAAPQLELSVTTQPMAGQRIQFAEPAYGDGSSSPTYDASSGLLSVSGYSGWSNQTPQWFPEECANGTQTLNMTECLANSPVTLLLTPNPANANQFGASCALTCASIFPLGASGSSTAAASMPTVTVITPPSNGYLDGVTVAIAPVSTATTSTTPISTYDSSTGLLTVQGYTTTYTGGSSTVAFQNGTQTLDTTTCPTGNTNVAFTFYPTSSQNVTDPTGLGFLSCQALSLPYVLCTMDQNASGGVLAVVTGTGAAESIELACACIPPYLSGPAVASGNANYLNTGTSAAPQGIMLGATSSNPTQICTGN